jgi:twitching motility two-component system response regulator PilH
VPKKILVVDDTKSIREIVAFMLRGKGYEIVESGDGVDAGEKARSLGPDLIVLDAMLPRKTGFDLCAELKQDERFRSIPILMLTALTKDTGKSDTFWRQKSKADDFMSKPFKVQDLVDRVEKLLERAGPGPAPR